MPSIIEAARGLVDEITAILEPRQNRKRRRRRLVLVERGEEFECYRAGAGGASLIVKGRLDELENIRLPRQLLAQPVELRLDGSRVLSKILRLPAAGRGYLDPIVRHQIERVTPWSADRVVFDYAIAEDEPAGEGQIAVRLVATARDVLDSVMGRLKAVGIEAEVVGTTEDPIDRPSTVNLLQGEGTGPRALLRCRVATALLAILVVGIGLSALAGWRLYALNRAAAEIGDETVAVRAEIETARAGMSLSDNRQRLLARKQDETPLVILIDALSQTVPTNTYLTQLSVADGEVHMAGLSSDAPALIGTLEASDLLSDVRFAAPTMRDEGASEDRFEIAARIASSAAKE